MPTSLTQSETWSGDRLMFTPNSDSTSALPDLDETDRLPCFATVNPAPATTKAVVVEILNV